MTVDHRSERRGARRTALVGCVVALSSLTGCIYSDAFLNLERTEPFQPLANGYWRLCHKEPGTRETCQAVLHENVRANSGVVTRADGSTVDYSTVPLGSGKFLVQLRRAWEGRDRYAYGFGETLPGGSVSLLSPDCSFPQSVRADLREAGVRLALSFRTCPPREDSVEALLAQFKVFARNRDWHEDGSVNLSRRTRARPRQLSVIPPCSSA